MPNYQLLRYYEHFNVCITENFRIRMFYNTVWSRFTMGLHSGIVGYKLNCHKMSTI
jgi:hypothetical protein